MVAAIAGGRRVDSCGEEEKEGGAEQLSCLEIDHESLPVICGRFVSQNSHVVIVCDARTHVSWERCFRRGGLCCAGFERFTQTGKSWSRAIPLAALPRFECDELKSLCLIVL